MAEVRDVEHVLSGNWHGVDAVVFEYRYSAGADAQGQTVANEYSCVLTPVPASWPGLIIEPERTHTKMADVLGLRDIDFENERFNRAFEVRSTEPRFASAFVDASMMAWLMDSAPSCGFEIVGHRLLVLAPRVYPWQIDTVLVTTASFLEHVPAVIGRYTRRRDPNRRRDRSGLARMARWPYVNVAVDTDGSIRSAVVHRRLHSAHASTKNPLPSSRTSACQTSRPSR